MRAHRAGVAAPATGCVPTEKMNAGSSTPRRVTGPITSAWSASWGAELGASPSMKNVLALSHPVTWQFVSGFAVGQ